MQRMDKNTIIGHKIKSMAISKEGHIYGLKFGWGRGSYCTLLYHL